MQSPLGPRVVIGGRERDYFSGTGYLGLHNHPAVLEAAISAIHTYGMSTATSRGGYGEHDLYDALEAAACAFFGVERVLYYPSGYFSAGILAQGLRERWDRAFIDDWSHYSLWDGARATGKPLVSFHHCDPQALAESLRRELKPGERPLVLSDGVFPISGEIAPVWAYQAVLAEYPGAWLVLDDAHATGVLGRGGRGTLEHAGALGQPGLIAGHTLSKGIGGYGGVIAGSRLLTTEVERNSRVTVGSSPPPLPAAAASARALELAADLALRQRLWANVRRARAGIRALGWDLEDSPVPILCLRARPGVDLARLKDALFQRDLCVAHVQNYTSTPPGGAIRIAIFATHSEEQIDRLVDGLRAVL